LNAAVRITVVTIFPEFFESPLRIGVVGRAIDAGIVTVDTADPRVHGKGAHRQVDDSPFGGGPGMVMMVEPMAETLEPFAASHRVFLTPSGSPLRQEHLDRWAELSHLTLVCGRYEGIDQRVIDHFIDEEVSLGDFVLAGGEAAALAVIEGVARLVPRVVGNAGSTVTESFRGGLLEEPVYTRPAEFRGWSVPDVLLSGDHARIEAWRLQQRIRRTRARRPDLAALLGEQADGPTSTS
jgi:tRNA (guanine37-N1)-methyltransferase